MSNTTIQPKIDDQFWFDYSEKLINTSHSNTDEAAKKLQNLVLWLWGIYTTYAAVGSSLQESSYPWFVTLLISLASVSLIVVYWGTSWVQMPVKTIFDTRSPDDIKDAYVTITNSKNRRFTITLYLSFLAAFMVSLALVLMSMNAKEKINNYEFIASTEKVNNIKVVSITAYVPNIEKVNLKVLDNNKTIIEDLKIIPTKDGIVQTNIPIKQSSNYTAIIEWHNKGTNIQLSKKINDEKLNENQSK